MKGEHYSAGVRRVLLITLFLNIFVVVVKIIAGSLANSLALISDGLHSSADGLNNIVGLVVLRYSTQEPDDDHPYGHQKIETLAAFCIAAFLAVTCYEIASSAVGRLFGPAPEVHVSGLTFASILLTLGVNIFVTIYEAREGKRLRSHFLTADAAHTRSDVYVTLTVLAGIVGVFLGVNRLDGIFALVVAALIARAGWRIFRETVPILVDASALPERDVRAIVTTVAGVEEVRTVRTRGWEGNYFIDITVASAITDAVAAHDLTERVEDALREAFGAATIHVHFEPK